MYYQAGPLLEPQKWTKTGDIKKRESKNNYGMLWQEFHQAGSWVNEITESVTLRSERKANYECPRLQQSLKWRE